MKLLIKLVIVAVAVASLFVLYKTLQKEPNVGDRSIATEVLTGF